MKKKYRKVKLKVIGGYKMEKNNLESKLKESRLNRIVSKVGKYIAIGATALTLSYASGCDEGPSEECCLEMNCEGNLYGNNICDGEGDNCYCRSETCCESINCDSNVDDYTCVTNEWDDSQCRCDYVEPFSGKP